MLFEDVSLKIDVDFLLRFVQEGISVIESWREHVPDVDDFEVLRFWSEKCVQILNSDCLSISFEKQFMHEFLAVYV